MPYREIHMVQLKEILLRRARGEAKKAINRSLGVHRKTITKYLKIAAQLGVDPIRDGPEAITKELVEKIKQEETEKSSPISPALQALMPHKSWIEDQVEGGLKGSKILQLLHRKGVRVTEATFYRFLREQCPSWIKHKITVLLPETEPGDYAQCDFGRMGKIYDDARDGNRLVHGFIMTLCFSRHQHVHACFKQDMDAVIQGCEAAFSYFGGVPKRIIFDNPKTIISKADRYEPVIHPSFLEYAQYRGFTVDPAVPRHAKGKPIVERSVPYVRQNFFAGETFVGIEDIQQRAEHWCTHTAGTRIHGTTGQKPLEVFEALEKQNLLPFDDQRFDTPIWAECKVHPDHHIAFCKATYSVNTRYTGKTVEVRGDSALVKIYFNSKLIKLHPRKGKGERSTDFNDYPKELTPYTLRNPQYQIQKGYKKHEAIGTYIEELLSGAYPWHRLRSAQKLLRMCDTYGTKKVAAACERFDLYGVYNVKRLERMLKKDSLPEDHVKISTPAKTSTQPLRFERDASVFNHHKKAKKGE